jgi:hypothetical protein
MCRGLISVELLLGMLDYCLLLAEVSVCQEVIPVLLLHSSNANGRETKSSSENLWLPLLYKVLFPSFVRGALDSPRQTCYEAIDRLKPLGVVL